MEIRIHQFKPKWINFSNLPCNNPTVVSASNDGTRDEPGSGSEWSDDDGNDGDISDDEFFVLPKDLQARKDALILEYLMNNTTSKSKYVGK